MNTIKPLLLWLYYWATLPARRRAGRQRAQVGTEPVSILLYHRIADQFPNDWTLSRNKFEQQIDWLTAHYDIVSLEEAQQRIASGRNDRPTVAITFDDGYADNSDFAVPMLLERKLPFTYFVTSGNVRDREPFPRDAAAGWRLRPNTVEQIRELAAAGVEIGAHTRTHPDLGQVTDEHLLRDEIVGAKEDLEAITGESVRYFSFPFGLQQNMSPTAFAIAHEAGFAGVCSGYGSYNLPGDDPFHLQRIHADPQMIRLKNWLTVDQRKLNSPVYNPGDYRQLASIGSPQPGELVSAE